MANRLAFTDFVHGLLNINPLERWTPQQARTHPFITQQKFTGPFQPSMSLKSSTSRSPAPGVQQQINAEAASKQRAQAAQQQQAQQQAQQHAAYAGMHMQAQAQAQAQAAAGYPPSPHAQSPQAVYAPMYTPSQQGAPPPYPSAPPAVYGQPMPIVQQPPSAGAHHYAQNSGANASLYAQATTRAGRQRASTMDIANGIPPALQRVVSHLDPNAPIRLQPSPAYYPPPPEGAGASGSVPAESSNVGGRRRTSRGPRDPRNAGNFVRQLEDRTLEEGWTGGGAGVGGGGWA